MNAKFASHKDKESTGRVSTPHSIEGKKKSELLKFQSKVLSALVFSNYCEIGLCQIILSSKIKAHYASSLKDQELQVEGAASSVPEHKYYIQHLEEYCEFTTQEDEPLVQLYPYGANLEVTMEQRKIIVHHLVKVGVSIIYI